MSSFLDDLQAAVCKVAADTQTEFQVAAREQKIKDAYRTLGRLYYKAVKTGASPEGPEFDEQTAKISALLQQINDLRKNQHVTAEDADFEDLT